jgi:hypothetical protein
MSNRSWRRDELRRFVEHRVLVDLEIPAADIVDDPLTATRIRLLATVVTAAVDDFIEAGGDWSEAEARHWRDRQDWDDQLRQAKKFADEFVHRLKLPTLLDLIGAPKVGAAEEVEPT